MKKLLLALGIASSMQFAYAQKSVYAELPGRLYTQGKEMFLNNNYVGCINTLQEFKKQTKDVKLIPEVDYLLLSSYYYQGADGIGNKLKDYLEKYPETHHRNQLSFFIGTTHFVEKDWQKAVYWFNQADMDYLSSDEQEDYAYRTAYAGLQSGNRTDPKRLFGILSRNSQKYAEPASYYLAYINFQEGNYDQALPIFRKLKNKGEYAEPASFFLVQGAYLQNDTEQTISEGKDYLSSYPQSSNATEVYRLLGSCYYRKGDIAQTIINYERYLQKATDPFREDMYQLGETYYRKGDYRNAIETLKSVASSTDLLGQSGQMLLGQSYLKVGDNANALLAFDAAARSGFDKTISEDALYNYVMVINKGSVSAFGQSITASQRFLSEYPNSKYTDNVNSVLATTLLSTKNYNEALNAIGRIKSPGRQILDAKQMILFQLGTESFINGDYETAAKDLNACINMGNYNTEARNEAYFWRAETAYRQGNYQQASRDYTTYIAQVTPAQANYKLAFYNLGYTQFKLQDYNSALNNFKKYVNTETARQSATYADALNRLGDCYLYNRNYSESERYYSQAVNVNPSTADYAEFQKAFVKGLQRDYAGKVSALNNMMAKYPESEYYDDALYEKSRALAMQGNDGAAIAPLEKLLADFPKSNLASQTGVQLGQLYFNTDNPQKAIAAYKQVINNYPNTEDARIAVQSLEGVYKDINDIGSYAAYVNSLGGSMSLSAGRQDSLTYLAAENIYMKGRKAEAKSSMEKYLQSYPRGRFSSDANFYLGTMAFDANDKVSALSYFKEVINSNNPKYIDNALIYASGIEYDNENYASAYGAYEHLNLVASSTENKHVAQLGMLRCAFLMNKDNEVVTAANKLLENVKTSPDVANEARFYRAKALMNLGKTDDAIKDLQQVGKDTRTVFGAESQFLIAESYYKSKSYDKAEKQVMDFMKTGTPHEYWMARAIIVLSDTYVGKGDKFQAQQYLESLQANYKGSESDIHGLISSRLAELNK